VCVVPVSDKNLEYGNKVQQLIHSAGECFCFVFCAYALVCVSVFGCACVRVCVCACIAVYACECVSCVCVRARVHLHVYAYPQPQATSLISTPLRERCKRRFERLSWVRASTHLHTHRTHQRTFKLVHHTRNGLVHTLSRTLALTQHVLNFNAHAHTLSLILNSSIQLHFGCWSQRNRKRNS